MLKSNKNVKSFKIFAFLYRIRVRDSDPLGRRRACVAPLQERREGAAGAHGAPCNIARPGGSRGSPMLNPNFPNIFLTTHIRQG